MGRFGTLGVGFISMGLSKIEADRDAIPGFLQGIAKQYDTNTSATYDYSDFAFLLGYANQVTDKLSLGAGMKVIRESIDKVSASSVAFDFGGIYRIGFHGASVGARISNIGKDMKFFAVGVPLPLMFSVGAGFDLVKNEKHSLMVRADATKPQDASQLVFSGGEYVYNDMLFLRAAWKFNYSGVKDTYSGVNQNKEIKTTEERYSMGAGVKLPMGKHKVAVDYAYTGFGLLNNVHRFSVGINLK
jgi:predicted porin